MARNWKQIEDSRDRRLWLSQVVLPVCGVVVAAMQSPRICDAFADLCERLGDAVYKAGTAFSDFIYSHTRFGRSE